MSMTRWRPCRGAIQKSYIGQNVIISVQQSLNRRIANRADTQVCPYPTHLLIHDMPVGADLCVRPSICACLHHFFVLHPPVGSRLARGASMILLDTHAIVWLASDQDRFTEKGRALIRDNAGQLYVSVVSAWEISMLHKRNRLQLPMEPLEKNLKINSRRRCRSRNL